MKLAVYMSADGNGETRWSEDHLDVRLHCSTISVSKKADIQRDTQTFPFVPSREDNDQPYATNETGPVLINIPQNLHGIFYLVLIRSHGDHQAESNKNNA